MGFDVAQRSKFSVLCLGQDGDTCDGLSSNFKKFSGVMCPQISMKAVHELRDLAQAR